MADANEPGDNVITMQRNWSEMGKKGGGRKRELAEALGPKPEDFKSRWQQLLDGELTVADLDDEELAKKRCKDRLGGFTGRPSNSIPRKLEEQMRAEFLKRCQASLESALPTAVAALSEVAGKSHYARDRVAAAQLLIERGLGKVPDKVELTTHSADPWEDVLQGIISEDNIEKAKQIVDKVAEG